MDFNENNEIPRRVIWKALGVSSIGTIVNYYDFFLGAFAAALVWPIIFFPSGHPAIAAAVSVFAYASTFLLRPLGAVIFGHIGDKFGRRKGLIWTLATAGAAMIGIALTPDYSTIGYFAPALLILFRIVFGIGFGGEWGGATAFMAEYASKKKNRGLWMSASWAGAGIGIFAGGIGFDIIEGLPHAAFIAWAWRVLFLIGAVVLILGVVIRTMVDETPLFRQVIKKREEDRVPSLSVIRKFPKKIILFSVIAASSILTTLIEQPYSIDLFAALAGVRHIAVNAGTLSLAIGVSALLDFAGVLVMGYVSDYIGRKKALIIGFGLLVAVIFPFFLLVTTLNYTNYYIANIMLQFTLGLSQGAVAALFNESFETKYRVSGSGFSFQLGTLYTGILVSIALPIVIATKGELAWQYVAVMGFGLALAGFIASFLVTETRGVRMGEEPIGKSTPKTSVVTDSETRDN